MIIHFQITPADQAYLPFLKPLIPNHVQVKLNAATPGTITEVILRAKQSGATAIATTSAKLLQLLLDSPKSLSLDDYAGSIIERFGYEFLILNPCEHLVTVPYGKFLYQRYFSKLYDTGKWLAIPDFTWNLFSPGMTDELLSLAEGATFISNDIETIRDDPDRTISCIGWSIVSLTDGRVSATTVVVPLDSDYNLAFCRRLAATPAAKVLQNGKYDIAYELRYSIPLENYSFDTKTLFHSWFSELPKRLDFITSFVLRKWVYWKSESSTGDIMEYYRYNAKDCFATAMSLIAILMEYPGYAERNFTHKFPLLFPSILAEQTGLKIDPVAKKRVAVHLAAEKAKALASLQIMVGCTYYNPGSWQQTQKLWVALGSEDIKTTDVTGQDKVASRHPLNQRICDQIKVYREASKAYGSYAGKDFTWLGRCYFALNPDDTVTGRNASKESQYWTGLQIHNIPVAEEGAEDVPDYNVKEMFVADPGYKLFECDYSQNETWIQAYTSGDTNLVAAIEDRSKDFHGRNIEAFFGVPYALAVQTTKLDDGSYKHKTLDKPLRNLAKRPNHGAAYNMTAGVMLDTMGIKNVIKAKQLLKLPSHWALKAVCQHLLDQFDRTYPVVRGDNYKHIQAEVAGTGLMVGPTGWTRRCFSNPSKDKRAMNMYAAHKSQSPAAMILDKVYLRVFKEVWLVERQATFKMGPQIHDSIMGQVREGREDIALKVQECMKIETKVTDIFGKVRVLCVPTDLKMGGSSWAGL